ncbi:MAG: DDE-type integrase/transposase/recombinase [Gammaproteobacteria bacterium]|nr:DDE-type integrase/transposase/recombinase [Gammaproteobacteria bacterium]
MKITRSNQVWCADVTCIRWAKGFVYLNAVMDWHSRYVLAWEVSVTQNEGSDRHHNHAVEKDSEILHARPEYFPGFLQTVRSHADIRCCQSVPGIACQYRSPSRL